MTAREVTHASSSATKKHRRYKILEKVDSPITVLSALSTFGLDLFGEIPMHINDKAPDFTLQDENGKDVALKELRGKTVVLYFYPRADTPG